MRHSASAPSFTLVSRDEAAAEPSQWLDASISKMLTWFMNIYVQ